MTAVDNEENDVSRLEPSDSIERIVGATRDPEQHIARAIPDERRIYILHSKECIQGGRDLRLCPYSLAADAGIDLDQWTEDEPHVVEVDYGGRLRPCGGANDLGR